MNKEQIYTDLKEILKREEIVEIISKSNTSEDETGIMVLESEILKDEPMKKYTSFKVGGPADIFVDPGTEERLIKTINYFEDSNIPYILMGNGSNIIFRDGGYRGAVILTNSRVNGSMAGLGYNDKKNPIISAGAGILLSTLAKIVASDSFTGMEFASGIPGTLGGALFMNAGAYGGEMKDIVVSARVYDPKTKKIEITGVNDMDLSYRHSAFQSNNKIILEVDIKLKPGNQDGINSKMKELLKKRNAKQPVNLPSAGSFFKRPQGHFAGKLIEDSGLRGLKMGGAQISELHAGFMVNKGGATSKDIEDLMEVVRVTVFDNFGVMLEPEVRIVGEK